MADLNTTVWDVIVIGGGAAGFFVAINLKHKQPSAKILIVEGGQKLLSKVKISGGGRCNVTHACYNPKELLNFYPRGHRKLQNNFTTFGPTQTVEWFEQQGVTLKTEADGRLFPDTNDSQTIVDCLLTETRQTGISIKTGCFITAIDKTQQGFTLKTNADSISAKNLVLATGGSPKGFKLANSLGHQCIDAVPSLFTFCIKDAKLNNLSGLSVPKVSAQLMFDKPAKDKPLTQTGPLLVTHWGFSGPAILKLSAFGARLLAEANYTATLLVDFFPDSDFEALRQTLLNWKQEHYKKQLKNAPSLLPERLWHYLLESLGLDLTQQLDTIKQKPFNKLAEQLKRWPFSINGKGVFKEEFVTAGGVPLNEIDLKTYESKPCPNLYIVGELLNIDGVTGGFNFQNAWTSGYIASQSITL